jgi:ABC-2 type transport system ATP-binding protein
VGLHRPCFSHRTGDLSLGEPTSNLDPRLAREIRSLILEPSRDKIVLYSSHNLFEAREVGRHVLAIKDGKLAMFDRIENLKGARFVVGVRVLEPSPVLADWKRESDYYLRELSGPEEVPALVHDLDSHGVKIRELREMGNPLEDPSSPDAHRWCIGLTRKEKG